MTQKYVSVSMFYYICCLMMSASAYDNEGAFEEEDNPNTADPNSGDPHSNDPPSTGPPSTGPHDVTNAPSKFGYPDETEPGFDLTPEEISAFKIWPTGVIPYYIDEISFDKAFREKLNMYLSVKSAYTGLSFLQLHAPPPDHTSRYLFFINRRSQVPCLDYTVNDFTNEGVQKIVLGYDCFSHDSNLGATILAIAGVPPQHNSPDREEYIKFNNTNVIPEKAKYFQIMHPNEWIFYDVEYDFDSAGHYTWHKYTKNGFATLEPVEDIDQPDDILKVGDSKSDLSYKDVLKIRLLYNYVLLNNKDTSNLDTCKQLFEPKDNISNYEPPAPEVMVPRPKPSKYTGKSRRHGIVAWEPDSNNDDFE